MISDKTYRTANTSVARFTILDRSAVAGSLTAAYVDDIIAIARLKKSLRSCNKKIGRPYNNLTIFGWFD
jgi:hypothetical protein